MFNLFLREVFFHAIINGIIFYFHLQIVDYENSFVYIDLTTRHLAKLVYWF